MGPTVRSALSRYGSAVLAVAIALVIRLALDPVLGSRLNFLFFSLAVVAVAWHGGIGPSILAQLLGLVAVTYFFLTPRYSPVEGVVNHQVQVTGFLFLGLTIGLFSERLRLSRRRAEGHARAAVRQQRELEQEVAQRKRLEQELQRWAGELAVADRRKDEFLAMLSHELRNPLAPIRHATQVMQLHGLSDPQLQWARDVIDRQVGHMARLVDDLLDVSRISRGMIALKKEVVELNLLIDRAVETSRPLVEARQHQLTVVLPAEVVWLDADSTRLAQVVANLLNNAAKYTQEGGQVRLTAERQGAEVVVRVADNGVGIDPEMLPSVFDLFVQADPSLDRSEGGLGIGLTLVKRLVELHGGSIAAFSAGLGQGSEFVVRLPIAPRPTAPLSNGISPVAKATIARRVLAVDDNADAVRSLALLLRLQGHEVRTAFDGPTALVAAEAFQPEVVLLDIGLPKMDGYEVARRLRQQPGLQKALLVAVTGYGQEEDRRQALAAGFDAHLVKPADLTVLQRLLAGGTVTARET